MCLYKRGSRKRAKEDIICYKVLIYNIKESQYYSKFKNYQWEIGVEKEAGKTKPGLISKYGEIGNGYFHSYKWGWGIYSYRITSDSLYRECIFRCIIPKGSYYYEGIHSDGIDGYASKKLKIIEELQ